MPILIALLSGLIFGLGLILAGMANPAKVLAFLDIAGRWDPSLMFVMGGGIVVAVFAFAYARSHDRSLLGFDFQLPKNTQLDRRLIGGSLVFGIGWGLAGICPGPALVLLGQGKALIFVGAMLVGMGVYAALNRSK